MFINKQSKIHMASTFQVFGLKKTSVPIVVLSGIKLVAGTTSAGLSKAFFF